MEKNLKYFITILLILLLLSACSSPRRNEVIYRFIPQENAISIDSLKVNLLDTKGLEMLAMYPDSDIVIIHYDRFQSHYNLIEKCFEANGYKFELLKKSPLEEIE
ncbi:MAG: hypothetical protein WCT23_01165 [Candidatus Neomarinimicrobiota bacterium]